MLPVEARGLVKRYGRITAVDGGDLTVEPGDVYGYLGPNGAGKTTSLRMMLGLIRPTAGEALLFGLCSPHWAELRAGLHRENDTAHRIRIPVGDARLMVA